jgi:hypothetical protein
MRKIVGVLGFIGSGKSTVGEYLEYGYGYTKMSFANNLKDTVAAVFGWPRHMLEGDTVDSRIWRETPDEFWSNKLNKTVTPRWAIQNIGTDVFRNCFYTDIWVSSLEKSIISKENPVVITDVRFPNEIELVKRLGGKLIWVRRNPEPEWFNVFLEDRDLFNKSYPTVHASEYSWIGLDSYTEVWNTSSISDLYKKIDNVIED